MLIILFQLFNLADFIFSYYTVIIYGVEEGNPLLSYLMSIYGEVEVLIVAKAIVVVLGFIIYKFGSTFPLAIVTVIYGLLTAYHLYLITLVV